MEVYIVLCECGEYDDWSMCVVGVFATEGEARAYIEGQTATLCRTADGELVETYMEDIEDVVETRDFAPAEHRTALSVPYDRQVGGTWYIDGDPRYYRETWHIERWEVQR